MKAFHKIYNILNCLVADTVYELIWLFCAVETKLYILKMYIDYENGAIFGRFHIV